MTPIRSQTPKFGKIFRVFVYFTKGVGTPLSLNLSAPRTAYKATHTKKWLALKALPMYRAYKTRKIVIFSISRPDSHPFCEKKNLNSQVQKTSWRRVYIATVASAFDADHSPEALQVWRSLEVENPDAGELPPRGSGFKRIRKRPSQTAPLQTTRRHQPPRSLHRLRPLHRLLQKGHQLDQVSF